MTIADSRTPVSPWAVSKLYYNHGFLRQRMQMLQDELSSTARRARSRSGSSTGIPTTTVRQPGDDARASARRISASVTMRCGRTPPRSTRIGDFFAAPMEWQQRLWPTEEFELARSRVFRARLPETELFAGIEAVG